MAPASARAKIEAARATESVDGGASACPSSAAIDVEIDARHAAGVDQLEVGEVDRDVERDAVVRDAAFDAEPERPDLPGLRTVGVAPAAGMAVTAGGPDAELGARPDERVLERANERTDEQAALVERHDRIGHQLARAVVGDLAAALDADDGDPASVQVGRAGEDVGRIAVAAQRQDRRVLQQQELVADQPVGALGCQASLQRVRLVVGDPPEPARLERPPTVGEASSDSG